MIDSCGTVHLFVKMSVLSNSVVASGGTGHHQVSAAEGRPGGKSHRVSLSDCPVWTRKLTGIDWREGSDIKGSGYNVQIKFLSLLSFTTMFWLTSSKIERAIPVTFSLASCLYWFKRFSIFFLKILNCVKKYERCSSHVFFHLIFKVTRARFGHYHWKKSKLSLKV